MKLATKILLAGLVGLSGGGALPQLSAQNTLRAMHEARIKAEWVTMLGQTDFARREEGFSQIVEHVLKNPGRERLVEELARGDDRELAWTSRLILREIRSRIETRTLTLLTESEHGIPRRWQITMRARPGVEPEKIGLKDYILDMEGILEACEALAEVDPSTGVAAQVPVLWHLNDLAPMRGFSGELDRVRTHVVEELGGWSDPLAPTILDELGALALPGVPQLSVVRETVPTPSESKAPVEVATPGLLRPLVLTPEKLGVIVAPEPLTDAMRRRYGVPEGLGVLVRDVVERSMAEAVSVTENSILIELNGRPIQAAEDITLALKGRRASDPVTVIWIDAAGTRLERTWRKR